MNQDTKLNADNSGREELTEESSHLIKSEANKKRLQDAIDEMNSGVHFSHKLIEK